MSVPTAHPYAFDPTHGYGLAELRALKPPPAPDGFDAFWRARYLRALGVDPAPSLEVSAQVDPRWRVRDVAYASTGGVQIRGWLLTPRDGFVERSLVVGHGYGGREAPDYESGPERAALLFPCFRGLARSRLPSVSSEPRAHVLHDIGDADRYILGGCVEDVWLAVSALAALFPQARERIGYAGASFGGGVGALAMAYDARIARGHFVVPTFANMPLWLTLPSVGSADSAQARQRGHGDAAKTLRLFDAAVAAGRIAAPTLVAAALFDPAVAPPCQFSLANARPTSNFHETVILDAGHFDYPGRDAQHAALRQDVLRFFEAL